MGRRVEVSGWGVMGGFGGGGLWVVVKGWEWGMGRWVEIGKGMGWWVELGGGGGAKGGTHHLINVGNSQHIFVASPDNESFF